MRIGVSYRTGISLAWPTYVNGVRITKFIIMSRNIYYWLNTGKMGLEYINNLVITMVYMVKNSAG
jgi:hypothetical protein